MQHAASHAALSSRPGPVAFLRERWAGKVPMSRMFWRDIMLYATVLNVASAMAGLLLFTSDLPAWVGLAVFMLPLPYNIFLVMAVWRKAGRRTGLAAQAYQLFSALWLIATVFI